jgi:hypothetical protein
MIRSAHLRVYLPEERAGRYPRHLPGRSAGPVASSDHFVWGEPTVEDAFLADYDGRTYVCPRYPRLRMLEGVLAFSNAYPSSGLIPERTVRHVAAELEELRSEVPTARSYILSSPWHVPLRWFLPFSAEQRTFYELGDGRSIRYRTLLGRGRPRVHRATEVLDEAGFDESVVDQVRDLARWLDEFTSEAMLELDYGTVASLFNEGDLVMDESAAEVAASIAALAELDYDAAGRSYASVASRWAHAQALTFAN